MKCALAHGYFTVDLGIVWQTVQNDLPALQAQVAALSHYFAFISIAGSACPSGA